MLANFSIRWRLTLWYMGTLLVILLGFSLAMHTMIRRHLYAQQDTELAEEANEVAGELLESPDNLTEHLSRHFSERGRFRVQVDKPDGTVLCGTPSLQEQTLPQVDWNRGATAPWVSNVPIDGLSSQRLYGRLVQTPSGPLAVRVVVSNKQVEENLQSFGAIVLAAAILALFAACFGGMLIARQALRPLERMTQTAERISMEDSVEMVIVENPYDELGRLATTLNQTFLRMRKSIKQMGQFTADAAHELRTPLAVLRLECDVALNGNPDPEDVKRSLALALEEIDRLSHIVDELLTLSRIDSGTAVQASEEVYLGPLVRDVAESLDVAATTKGVQLQVGEIPEGIVRGDDVALSRLFFNLIDNAIKFTPPGGKIKLAGKLHQGLITITVADTGIGIDRRHWDHLFDRFYRVDASRNFESGGAGLGLAICKSIADAHSAKIAVTSEVGQGSTFSVTFTVIPVPVEKALQHGGERISK